MVVTECEVGSHCDEPHDSIYTKYTCTESCGTLWRGCTYAAAGYRGSEIAQVSMVTQLQGSLCSLCCTGWFERAECTSRQASSSRAPISPRNASMLSEATLSSSEGSLVDTAELTPSFTGSAISIEIGSIEV